MSLKINEMRKCHPHQGFWGRGEVGDFASRDAGEANPRGLTQAVAIRYKDSGPSEPNAVILRGIYRLQLKSGRFSVNSNAESVRPIKDSVLGLLRYCLRPSIKQTGEKLAEGPQLGMGRVRHATPGQDGSAMTKDQLATSGDKE
jgi:hypothetical protein